MVNSIAPSDGVAQQENQSPTLPQGNSPFSSPRKKFKAAISPSQKQLPKIVSEDPFIENKKDEIQEMEFSAKSKQGTAHSFSALNLNAKDNPARGP